MILYAIQSYLIKIKKFKNNYFLKIILKFFAKKEKEYHKYLNLSKLINEILNLIKLIKIKLSKALGQK